MIVNADGPPHGSFSCTPRKRLDDIRLYDTVQVTVRGPHGLLDVERAGLSPEVRGLFSRDGGSTARNVPQAMLPLIEAELRRLDAAPAKAPRGPETKTAVLISDIGLRELLLKLNEAVRAETGEENDDFVSIVGDLMEEARNRGIEMDGTAALEGLAPAGPRP